MIHHFYSSYTPRDPSALQRQSVARATWAQQPWRELPVPDDCLPRLWSEEGRHYPYVRDIFDFACLSLPADAILCYTNADLCVRSDCAVRIAAALQSTHLSALYSMRRDFNHDFAAPILDDEITRGDAYVGSDLYAFRASWWRIHGPSFPDMLIACELWDAVLRHLITITNPGARVSLPDLSYHRRHASWWEDAKNRYRLRGQIHNLRLGSRWLREHDVNPQAHGVPKRAAGYAL